MYLIKNCLIYADLRIENTKLVHVRITQTRRDTINLFSDMNLGNCKMTVTAESF